MTMLSYDALHVAYLCVLCIFYYIESIISLLKSMCRRLGCLKNVQVFSHKLDGGKLPAWVLDS